MRKLTDNTWFKYKEGHAVIYAKRKDNGQRVAAFTCHESCIPLIQKANSLSLDNVVLRPFKRA